MDTTQRTAFPASTLIPKEETQAAHFLKEYPEYDGRGVVVGIFDSGVDPGAEGLRVTSEGKVKVIDCVDCSGSGDVDTSTVVQAGSDGTLQGLSGRKLKLGTNVINPTGQYHLGIVRAFDIFPQSLVTRVKCERKDKFDEQQRIQLAQIRESIDAAKDNKTKQVLEVQLEQLKELQSQYEDFGPVYDCVVFHDGNVWRSVIDLDESGDLTGSVVLTDYFREHQISTFGHNSMLNFAINIYEEGNVLSIVTSGSHGTHVAGILGACYPDSPELNGIAPGVQIVSMKIGDTRLGTMETGTALVRAAIHAIRSKVDLINMSYGEAATVPNEGRSIQIAKELVNKHNITFLSSAGNNGPALSTVGCPGGTTTELIGVGAYVSGPMMDACYSMRKELPEMQYTWSSRGPAPDGHQGVCITAPGGAVSPVPGWLLTKSMLMNGTSMSSPNCCGGIALLISALKAEGVKYTPHTIRRAIENLARPVPGYDSLALGSGLLQVHNAYKHLVKYSATYANPAVHFNVDLPLHHGGSRGVYLRNWEETQQVLEATVRITPVFHDAVSSEEKIRFERRYKLVASHPDWIEVPKHLLLSNGERSFLIKVDPTVLEPNSYHFGEVCAIDVEQPQAGPAFRVPITVIRPLQLSLAPDSNENKASAYKASFCNLSFHSGGIQRQFVSVPHGATHAIITVRGVRVEPKKRFVLHTLHLTPQRSYAEGECEKYIWLETEVEEVVPVPVKDGTTIELCLAQFWSGIGDSVVDLKVEFHGLKITTTDVGLYGSSLIKRIDVESLLRKEELSPEVSLEKAQSALLPSSHAIRLLPDDRDRLPEGRQIYEMVMTYNFKLSEAAEITPRFPVLSTLLYESPYEAQFWMIFNANKRLVGFGDFRPEPKKLSKGSFTLRLQIRHDRVDMLEKLKATEILLEKKISKSINLPIYPSLKNALTDDAKFPSAGKAMKRGRQLAFFIGRVEPSALPKDVSPGDLLLGTLSTYKNLLPEKKQKLSGVNFAYVVQPSSSAPAPSSQGGAEQGKDKEYRTPEEALEEYIFEKKVEYADQLLKSKRVQEFDALAKALLSQRPDYLPLLSLNLKRAVHEKELQEIVAAADAVIKSIDISSLALHLVATQIGTKSAIISGHLAKEREAQLEAFRSALINKAQALVSAALTSGDDKDRLLQEAEAALDQLKMWADVLGDSKCFGLLVSLHSAKSEPATALKHANKHYKELTESGQLGDQERSLYEQRLELIHELGWTHWETLLRAAKPALYPSRYVLF